MRGRNSGYSAATARAMALRTAKREKARIAYFTDKRSKKEIIEELGVSRCTLNFYLRD